MNEVLINESSVSAGRIPRLAIAAALIICAFTALPFVGSHFEYYPGDLVDSRLNMFFLEHGYKWISGHASGSYLDAPFFYPARGVLSYSENLLGTLPFYAPWRALGFDRETSFQIWAMIGFLLNYAAAMWVLSKLRFHWVAVLTGGYVFAFSQAALAQMGHIQLHYRFAVPLAWYFLYLFLERFSWKDLLGCLFFAAWQFYCGLYDGYFLALFLVAFAVAMVIRKPVIRQFVAQATPASLAAQGAIVAGFLGVLGVLAYPYMKATGDPQLSVNRWQETISMLPRPVSYLLSAPGNYETGWLIGRINLPMSHEHLMFVGLIPWACVLFLLFTFRTNGRHPAVVPSILALLGIIALTLYVGGMSPYLLLMQVPGVTGIRAVSRWIVVLLLPFSLAVAQVADLTQRRFQNIRRPVVLLLAGVAILALAFENHTAPPRSLKSEAQERLTVLAAQLPSDPPSRAILASLQPGSDQQRQPYELDAMLLAQDRNIVTVNGYSSRLPKGYRFLRTCADLKVALDDTAAENNSFPIQDAASRVIVLGTAADSPCRHLDTTRSVQTEPLPDSAFRARIEVDTLASVKPGAPLTADVHVTNQSGVTWRAKGLANDKFALLIGCLWKDPEASGPPHDYENRFQLPYDLVPGDSASIPVALSAPAAPGSYALQCDVVQELVHWFGSMGSPVGIALVRVGSDEGPAVEGYVDRVDSEVIAGWAWEKDHPDRPVSVDIYDGSARLATIPASIYRADLQAAQKGNGSHGFNYRFRPSAGKVHSVRVLVAGTNVELVGSPAILKANR